MRVEKWGVVAHCRCTVVIEGIFMAVNDLTVLDMVMTKPIYNSLEKLITRAGYSHSELPCDTEVCVCVHTSTEISVVQNV